MATAKKTHAPEATPVAKSERRVQPKCGDCNHPKSFHKDGTKRCTAMACSCPRWKKPIASITCAPTVVASSDDVLVIGGDLASVALTPGIVDLRKDASRLGLKGAYKGHTKEALMEYIAEHTPSP